MPQIFDTEIKNESQTGQPLGFRRFTLPRFVEAIDADRIAQATTTLRYLLTETGKIAESLPDEKQWTTVWRIKFHDLLEQLNRPDAHATLDWLLDAVNEIVGPPDLTQPTDPFDLQMKIMQWPHLGEQFIGAKAVGNLLLAALKREKKAVERQREVFNATTQQDSAKNTFELMTGIRIPEVDAGGKTKEKAVAPSSVPMSESNIEAGRIRLYKSQLDELEQQETEVAERLDYVTQAVNVIAETYDLLLHVSIQNQGLRKNNYQQGA